MKTCLIEQPSGLGDILLTIKIADYFYNNGYNVIYPVLSTYNYLNKYLQLNCEIDFVDINKDFFCKNIYLELSNKNLSDLYEDNRVLFIPIKNSSNSKKSLKFTNKGQDYKNVLGKFEMCSLDHNNWQDYFEIKRNEKEEENLINFLKIKFPYHLINREFGTPPYWREKLNKNVEIFDNLNILEMKVIDNFNAFSWLKVFENATRIDTVSTSNFYFFEKINLKCIPTIYSRNHSDRTYQENFEWMEVISRKKYNFVS